MDGYYPSGNPGESLGKRLKTAEDGFKEVSLRTFVKSIGKPDFLHGMLEAAGFLRRVSFLGKHDVPVRLQCTGRAKRDAGAWESSGLRTAHRLFFLLVAVHPRRRRGNTLPCPLGKAPGCLDTGAGWEFHDKGRVWSAADESPRASLPAILAAWSSAKGESRSGSGVGTKIRSGSSVKN